MSSNSIRRCFVPNCTTNSKNDPHVIFIKVPYTKERLKWFEAVGKAVDAGVNYKSTYHCCEAHFNVCITYNFKNVTSVNSVITYLRWIQTHGYSRT